MIEIEIKYAAIPAALDRIRTEGTFLKEKRMRNVYYDSSDWELTRKCIWLRERDGAWELKTPVEDMPMGQAFHEYETEEEICVYFGWDKTVSVSEHIVRAGFTPFVDMQTVREQWTWKDVHVDIDATQYVNGTEYTIVELEMMAETAEQAPAIRERIDEYAKELGLQGGEVMGKVIWYIHEFAPRHFQALVDSGCWGGR